MMTTAIVNMITMGHVTQHWSSKQSNSCYFSSENKIDTVFSPFTLFYLCFCWIRLVFPTQTKRGHDQQTNQSVYIHWSKGRKNFSHLSLSIGSISLFACSSFHPLLQGLHRRSMLLSAITILLLVFRYQS